MIIINSFCKAYLDPKRQNNATASFETFVHTFDDPSMIDPNRKAWACACYITESQVAAGHNGNSDCKRKPPV